MSALEGDDLLPALVAAREQLVSRMEDSRGQPYAALFKMYLEVQEKIRELNPPDISEGTPLDEFTQRLNAKRESGSSATG